MTYLFTDIEGSTVLWERYPAQMARALELHDELLRAAIDDHDGYVFSTAGDAFGAAFTEAQDAVAAARVAQDRLRDAAWPLDEHIRVRMGLNTGTAHERAGNYFGPTVNRAARIMAAGHGGQVLMSAATAELVDDDPLVYLGEYRLKDLTEPERIFQVEVPGFEFDPLRTLDATPGNLPIFASSFVGRDEDVRELSRLALAERLVTLTGVGGVGKTRLAVQVAAELTTEFPDGVWLVALGPVGNPGAVPDAVATTLGVTGQAGTSIATSIARALSGRRILVVLDNCEHVLAAAAHVVETIVAQTTTVSVITTSREGLQLPSEHIWHVSSLDTSAGSKSAAFELFSERARSVNPAFDVDGSAEAVTEICTRLDGIALAIELAAARMVSMSAAEVRDRLDDRFRLLSGARHGLERHQTLRHAVGWSYDLLESDEQSLLSQCSVFAGGFELPAVLSVTGGRDEYDVLDGLDSLVRKSLVTTDQTAERTRYGMLETIRQFAEEQLESAGDAQAARDGHARYFADQAIHHWHLWDGPGNRAAVDWVDTEFANLRAGFRWATDQGDTDTAVAIAAHTAMLALSLQRFEPVGWAEELLPAATASEVSQLPRLYTAASLCLFSDRSDDAVTYARAAVELEDDPRYDPFPHNLSSFREANAHYFAGRLDIALEIFTRLTDGTGPAHVCGLCGQAAVLATQERHTEAVAIAEESVEAALALANPYWVVLALHARGLAYRGIDPARAREAFKEGLAYAHEHRAPFFEVLMSITAARLAAVVGRPQEALPLFDSAIDALHRSGDLANLAFAIGSLAWSLERYGHSEAAATLYGAIGEYDATAFELPTDFLDRLREELGPETYEQCLAAGAALDLGDVVRLARDAIREALGALASSS